MQRLGKNQQVKGKAVEARRIIYLTMPGNSIKLAGLKVSGTVFGQKITKGTSNEEINYIGLVCCVSGVGNIRRLQEVRRCQQVKSGTEAGSQS
jgi:hypothetical protein